LFALGKLPALTVSRPDSTRSLAPLARDDGSDFGAPRKASRSAGQAF
jgi:hypothetical protein